MPLPSQFTIHNAQFAIIAPQKAKTKILFSMQQKPFFPTHIDRKMKEGTIDGILCCFDSCSHARIKYIVRKRMQF